MSKYAVIRLGQDADARRVHVRLRGQQLGSRRERRMADAAPEVELVGEVGAQRVGGEPEPVGEREASGRVAQHVLKPQLPKLRADAGIDGHVEAVGARPRPDGRQDRGLGQAGAHPRLMHPRDRLRDVEVGGEHRVDDLVENRIGEGPPPFQRLVGARLGTLRKRRPAARESARGPAPAAPARAPARRRRRRRSRGPGNAGRIQIVSARCPGSPRATSPSRASLNQAVNASGPSVSRDRTAGTCSHFHSSTSRASGAGAPSYRPTMT